MTMASAVAQTNTVHAFETTQLKVVEVAGNSYSWELYNEVTGINIAAVPGNCPADQAFFAQGINTGHTVSVTWLKPGIYFYKVTAIQAGGSNNIDIGKVEVLPGGPTAILAVNTSEICSGESAGLQIAFTGNAPWSIKLQIKNKDGATIEEYKDIGASNNPYLIPVGPGVTTEYTIVEVADITSNSKDSSNTVSLTVHPLPVSSSIYLKQNPEAATQTSPAIDKVCKGAVRTYRINGEPGAAYKWILLSQSGDTVTLTKPTGTDFTDTDKDSAAIQGSEIDINWEMNPGTYTLKAVQRNGARCETIKQGNVEVVPQAVVFAGADQSTCSGGVITLGESTASNFSTLEWTTAGDGVFNNANQLNPVYTPGTADLASGNVTLTLKAGGLGNDGSCSVATDQVSVIINPTVVPQLPAIGPLWQNSNPPTLPAITANGIKGSWDPAIINTSSAATTNYTFSPDSGQCASPATISITVNPLITPTFEAIGPFCANSTAPALPTVSTNNLTGTWSPSVVNTATAGTFNFTFTPDTAQGGIQITKEIVIIPQVIPAFEINTELWLNSTPPVLATTSSNGITGKWTPEAITTSSIGITTYTFVPDSGQCAASVTKDVTVKTLSTPTFNPLGPLCINATPPSLPRTSTNGITGTWVPDTIITSAEGVFSFRFTPDENQGSVAVTVDLLITPKFVPEFDAIADLWQNASAPALPGTSKNNIPGTWYPSTIQTSTAGTKTYTFTPSAGICATQATMNVTVKPLITPIFDPIGPFCVNIIAQPLPSISKNNIKGTWAPAEVNTSSAGTFSFTFTPDEGQGSVPYTTSITVATQIIPTFSSIGPLWQNSTPPALPSTSINGITGVWTPSAIETSSVGSVTYSFRPDYGQCAAIATMNIEVVPLGTPLFDPIAPLCQNSSAPRLPSISLNNIAGTWNPSTISTTALGTITYIFTPTNSQGTVKTQMDITVIAVTIPEFDAIGPLVMNYTAPSLPRVSKNGISGSWDPSTINTSIVNKTNYKFTPDAGQCASSVSLTVEVKSVGVPTFNTIGPFCLNSTPAALPIISTNGIVGTWTPSTINTSAVGTFKYTFNPEAGQGSDPVTIDIQIVYQVTPTFTQMGPFWLNSTPQMLPTTSLNGFTGTWTPSVINTVVLGPTTYTFTPDAGQCATQGTMTITINQLGTPVFDPIGPFCRNTAPVTLPVVSKNGIAGTWTPSMVATANAGTFKFIFTPDPGQGSMETTTEVVITEPVTPTFDAFTPFCQNSKAQTLPTHSNNGITGTWYPAIVNTAYAGTYTYTFTPDDNQCAKPVGVPLTITPTPVIVISPISPLCSNAAPVILTATPAGGTFSGPGVSGSSFEPKISGAGLFAVTYSIETDCGTIKNSILVSVTAEPKAAISYAGSPFCPSAEPVSVKIDGTTGGLFSVTTDGLSINAQTGQITPSTSKPGIYQINYKIAASGGCGDMITTTQVEISPATRILASPANQSVTYPEAALFGVQAQGSALTYQWQVNQGNGFINVTDSETYSGSTSDTLRLTAPQSKMTGFKYRVIVSGLCQPAITSGEALLTVTIKPIDLKVTVTALDKVYDGNDVASVSLTYKAEAGDSIMVNYTRASFEDKNAEDSKVVTVEGITISGRDAAKYAVGSAITTTASITVKEITVQAVGDGKVYDGTFSSLKVPAVTPDLALGDVGYFLQTFADKNVGQGILLTPSGQISDGNNGKNYRVTFETTTNGVISPRKLTGSFTVANKEYDATSDATILTRSLEGVVGGDSLDYVGGIATFDTPDVGFDKVVTGTNFLLDGRDRLNYTVNDTAYTKAHILIIGMQTSLTVNKNTFTHNSDLLTLTATITGGAALKSRGKAAASTTFYVEGQMLRDHSNNANIPIEVKGQDLVASITVSLLETTITGSIEPGTKEAVAYFNDENGNVRLNPNPARASLEFNPSYNLSVYPNPSPGPVNFKITVDNGAMATLDLFTPGGELVGRLFEGHINAGETKVIPYRSYMPQGVYRYRAIIGNEVKWGNVIIITVY